MLERIGDGLVNIFNRYCELFFSVGTEFSATSLICALLIAGGFFAYRRYRKRGRVRLRLLVRALFPKRILRHPSFTADVGYFLFNTAVYGAIFGMATVSYQLLTNGVLQGLIALGGPVTPSALPSFVQNCIVTAMLFLAYEFGYWLDHYLKHRIPVLWELHKVHHSAEVLTPLTVTRMHPLDTVIFGNILAVTAALTNGVVAYLFGDSSYQYALSGNNIILVAFIHLYSHLQHTHIWIAFRGVLGRVFVSPAHHQIHHSTNPIHFNKNWELPRRLGLAVRHAACSGQGAREADLRHRTGGRQSAHHHRRVHQPVRARLHGDGRLVQAAARKPRRKRPGARPGPLNRFFQLALLAPRGLLPGRLLRAALARRWLDRCPLRQHRDRLDLEQRARPRQLRHRDGRAGRRRRRVEELVAHFAENADVVHADEVIVDLHHVLELRAGGNQRKTEVFEGLGALRAEVTGAANELVVEIEAELAGDVDRAAGPMVSTT